MLDLQTLLTAKNVPCKNVAFKIKSIIIDIFQNIFNISISDLNIFLKA